MPRDGIRKGRTLALVWLTAFDFRVVFLGTPPVLPAVRSDLHLSLAAAGSVSSLVVACLGAGAIPGALLVGRFGPRAVVTAATVGLGAAALARLLPPQAVWLFAGTALLTLSVAAAQPGLTLLLRLWFPDRVQRAATIMTLGLFAGGLAGFALTPLLAALLGWRGSFALWGLCAVAGAALWARFAPPARSERFPTRLAGLAREQAVWLAALLFASQNLAFYNAGTWIPFELHRFGTGTVALVLFLANAVNIPIALGLARWRRPFATWPGYYLLASALTLVGSVGLLLGLDRLAWALAIAIGAGTGLTFLGALSVPPLVARESDVAGFSALVLGAGYLAGFAGPAAGGVAADRAGTLSAAFLPSVAGGLLMAVAGLALTRLPWQRQPDAPASGQP
jgi:MFS transporter, CP family, cyanate transporter